MILSSVEFPMMPSTNTRQDTTVLIYLKVSLISMDPLHGGGAKVRGGAPTGFPALGICGGAEDPGTLALDPFVQEVLVGGVIISLVSQSSGVAPAGGNPLSSPWTPATLQARINATRARPHRLGSSCMLLPAPVSVGWPLRCFQSLENQQAKKDRTLRSAIPVTPLQIANAERKGAVSMRAKVTQVYAPGETGVCDLPAPVDYPS